MSNQPTFLIVNFGGPRSKAEISSFLRSLLTDQDVIRTKLPSPIHRWFFNRIADKRAMKISPDYDLIGGKSPIYEDTEAVAQMIREATHARVLTFHRYLPETHEASIDAIHNAGHAEIRVFPMFPQFSYATTGSIARFFSRRLAYPVVKKMRWIKSYCAHPAYIKSMQNTIRDFLASHGIRQNEAILLFSAHGVPQDFIFTGDIYESECRLSYETIKKGFPEAVSQLSYQSKFGPGEWLRPYTNEICESVHEWNGGRKHVVFVPLSFTSDHIETLFEVEYQYMPLIRKRGLKAWRCPALNRRKEWIDAVIEIMFEHNLLANQMLVRKE
jgi:ferrochelatase